jgi:hypothetical protein
MGTSASFNQKTHLDWGSTNYTILPTPFFIFLFYLFLFQRFFPDYSRQRRDNKWHPYTSRMVSAVIVPVVTSDATGVGGAIYYPAVA